MVVVVVVVREPDLGHLGSPQHFARNLSGLVGGRHGGRDVGVVVCRLRAEADGRGESCSQAFHSQLRQDERNVDKALKGWYGYGYGCEMVTAQHRPSAPAKMVSKKVDMYVVAGWAKSGL